MSVNVEGNGSRISERNSRYQSRNGRTGSLREKSMPQPETEREVSVSISQEGMESYRKQTHENGTGGRVIAKGNKESIIREARQAAS